MIHASLLEKFCHDFLLCDVVSDPYCKNGLQVPGKQEVQKVALATTVSLNILHSISEWGADAVIVHHGLFWGKGVQTLSSELANRLRVLLQNNISLLAYHLPLDAHISIGNNAKIAQMLHLTGIQYEDICAIGNLPQSLSFTDFSKQCQEIFGQPIVHGENFSQKHISRIGICSGGGADFLKHCQKHNVDTFLTGEISEQHYHTFREAGVSFVACGHHATERCGIQALCEVLTENFSQKNVSFQFFPESCPV